MKQKPSYSSVSFEKYKFFVKQINHTSVFFVDHDHLTSCFFERSLPIILLITIQYFVLIIQYR
jgi:hypothetical protein